MVRGLQGGQDRGVAGALPGGVEAGHGALRLGGPLCLDTSLPTLAPEVVLLITLTLPIVRYYFYFVGIVATEFYMKNSYDIISHYAD